MRNADMSDKKASWLKKLGVTALPSSEEEVEGQANADLPDGVERADTGGGPGGPGGGLTVEMEPPIGMLQLISVSRKGAVYEVTVASSSKDWLLFQAVASGDSVGTVKISQPSGTVTLKDVEITSIQSSTKGIQMRLEPFPDKGAVGGARQADLPLAHRRAGIALGLTS